jgi:hypothetical protein
VFFQEKNSIPNVSVIFFYRQQVIKDYKKVVCTVQIILQLHAHTFQRMVSHPIKMNSTYLMFLALDQLATAENFCQGVQANSWKQELRNTVEKTTSWLSEGFRSSYDRKKSLQV